MMVSEFHDPEAQTGHSGKLVLTQAPPFANLVSRQGWPKGGAQQSLSIRMWPLCVTSYIRTALFPEGMSWEWAFSNNWVESFYALVSKVIQFPLCHILLVEIPPRSIQGFKDPISWWEKYHRIGGCILKLPQEATGLMLTLLPWDYWGLSDFTPPQHCMSCSTCWSETRLSPSSDPDSQNLFFFFTPSSTVHGSWSGKRTRVS